MTEYKSEVKKIFAPIGRVYERLADLNNLAVIQQGLDNPEAMERIKQQAGDKVTPEQLLDALHRLRIVKALLNDSQVVEVCQSLIDASDGSVYLLYFAFVFCHLAFTI